MPNRSHPLLSSYAAHFTQSFTELAPGVWSAVGFAKANVHIIEGKTGLVVIDSTDSINAAQAVMAQVRKVTQKPVRTLIYTHGHRDYIGGASVFANDTTEIIAAAGFQPEIAAQNSATNQPIVSAARARRTRRIVGADLPKEDQLFAGSGHAKSSRGARGTGYLPPTRTVDADGTCLEDDGLRLELHSAPGKSPDHIVVWHPQARTLFCGGSYYAAFPNLAAIRGSGARDFEIWARSLDRLIAFEADVLAPGHTKPVVGADIIQEVLGDYRDAIRHIILATVEGLNSGRSVDELAQSIALPQALASKPHLQEVYGRVDWAVRAYAQSALGWLDGNPTSLARLSPKEEATRVIALAGGPDAVLLAAEEADDPQWSMELCDRLIATGHHVAEARGLKHACLRILGESEQNAIARNYYLSCALEMDV